MWTSTVVAVSVLGLGPALQEVTPSDAVVLTEAATLALSQAGTWDVLSGREIEMALELEGKKLSAGCSAEASCLAEIAGAMDARYVLFGTISVIDDKDGVLSMSLYDSHTTKTVGRGRVVGATVGELSTRTEAAVLSMAQAGLGPERARVLVLPFVTPAAPAPVEPAAADAPPPWTLIGGLSAGAVATGGAVLAFGTSLGLGYVVMTAHNTAHDASTTPAAAEEALTVRNQWAFFADAAAVVGVGLTLSAVAASAVGVSLWAVE